MEIHFNDYYARKRSTKNPVILLLDLNNNLYTFHSFFRIYYICYYIIV